MRTTIISTMFIEQMFSFECESIQSISCSSYNANLKVNGNNSFRIGV